MNKDGNIHPEIQNDTGKIQVEENCTFMWNLTNKSYGQMCGLTKLLGQQRYF